MRLNCLSTERKAILITADKVQWENHLKVSSRFQWIFLRYLPSKKRYNACRYDKLRQSTIFSYSAIKSLISEWSDTSCVLVLEPRPPFGSLRLAEDSSIFCFLEEPLFPVFNNLRPHPFFEALFLSGSSACKSFLTIEQREERGRDSWMDPSSSKAAEAVASVISSIVLWLDL